MTADDSPGFRFVGPTPLGESKGDQLQLRGRDDDIYRLESQIRDDDHFVGHLTAASGVGKTSLLRAGLIPALRKWGYRVIHFAAWSDLPEDRVDAFATAIASGCEAEHAVRTEGQPDIRRQPGEPAIAYLKRLHAEAGGRLVIIFDQVEELFRQSPSRGLGLLATIRDARTARKPFPFRYVLSLRAEYRDELSPLERALDPGELWSYRLRPVPDDTIPEIIEHSTAGEFTFDEDVVEEISRLWSVATDRQTERYGYGEQIGLLHLRGLLWNAWHEIRPRRGDRVTTAMLREHRTLPDSLTGADVDVDTARGVFAAALGLYLKLALTDRSRSLEEAATASDPNLVGLGAETLSMIAGLASLLSSGSYKLVRDWEELALTGLPDLHDLGFTEQDLEEVVAWAASTNPGQREPDDPMGSTRTSQVVAYLGKRRSDLPETRYSAEPPDPSHDGSAGRLRGQPPAEVLAALVVAYERALEWMREANIVRVEPGRGGRMVVGLSHDGFGPPLVAWGAHYQRTAEARIAGLTALSGQQVFSDGNDPGEPTIKDRVVSNLVWRGCSISGHFRNVTFRNCDFSGSVFRGAQFTDVQMEDCCLWGVKLENIGVGGSTGLTVSATETASGAVRTDNKIQGLTLRGGRLAAASPGSGRGGVTFRGLDGYGLYLDGVSGGPVLFDSCRLRHVLLRGSDVSRPLWQVEVVSSELWFLEILDNVISPVTARDKKAKPEWLDYAKADAGAYIERLLLDDGPNASGSPDIRRPVRFDEALDPLDLDDAIEFGERSLNVALHHGLDLLYAAEASKQALRLQARYLRDGDGGDLDRSIDLGQGALRRTPTTDPDWAWRAGGQANRLQFRYSRSGNHVDLDQAIDLGAQALHRTPENDPDWAWRAGNQANRLGLRFLRNGSLEDLDDAIDLSENALDAVESGTPGWASRAAGLANRIQDRYARDGNPHDLDDAIDLGQQALEATPDGAQPWAWRACEQASRLQDRYARDGNPQDLDEAIDLGQHALDATPGPDPSWAWLAGSQANRIQDRYARDGNPQDLDEAIDLGQQALDATLPTAPDWAPRASAQATRLGLRFLRDGSPGDLDDAIDLSQRALDAVESGTPGWASRAAGLANRIQDRYARDGNPQDLDEAIDLGQQALDATSLTAPDWASRASAQATRLRLRFERNGDPADLAAADSLAGD